MQTVSAAVGRQIPPAVHLYPQQQELAVLHVSGFLQLSHLPVIALHAHPTQQSLQLLHARSAHDSHLLSQHPLPTQHRLFVLQAIGFIHKHSFVPDTIQHPLAELHDDPNGQHFVGSPITQHIPFKTLYSIPAEQEGMHVSGLESNTQHFLVSSQ